MIERRKIGRAKVSWCSANPKISQRHVIPVRLPRDQKYRWSKVGGIMENRGGMARDENLATLFQGVGRIGRKGEDRR